ncbi:MAG: DegT/DnrJ/EryC1/StrS family aminotransferase, partial [Blastocatellia bacterium]
GLPITLPPQPENGDLHSWHLYAIRLTDSAGVSREEFIQQMSARGIGCSVHFIPLHLHPYWQKAYDLQPHDFPAAWRAYERAISLPLYTKMTDDDQTRVIEAVKDVLAGNRVELMEEESVVSSR